MNHYFDSNYSTQFAQAYTIPKHLSFSNKSCVQLNMSARQVHQHLCLTVGYRTCLNRYTLAPYVKRDKLLKTCMFIIDSPLNINSIRKICYGEEIRIMDADILFEKVPFGWHCVPLITSSKK